MKRAGYIFLSFIVATVVHVKGFGLTEEVYYLFELNDNSKFDFIISQNYYIMLDLAIYLFIIDLLIQILRKKNVFFINIINKANLNNGVNLKTRPKIINLSVIKDNQNGIPKGTKILLSCTHVDLEVQGIEDALLKTVEEGIIFDVYSALKGSKTCNFAVKLQRKPSALEGVQTYLSLNFINRKRCIRKKFTVLNNIEINCVGRYQ